MNAKRLLLAGLLALMAGCVPIVSLRPLFTTESIVFEEELLGTWAQDDDHPEVIWEFARLDETLTEGLRDKLPADPNRFYHVTITDEDGHKGIFLASLVRLEGRLFLDVFADRFPSGERAAETMKLVYNAFFFIPAHTFMKVALADGQLTIWLTDDDRFKEWIEAEPKAIAHEVVDGRPILTAPTNELQSFVTKYINDERLFPTEINLVVRDR